MLPISSSLFRANGSSPNFHKSVLSDSCTRESSKHPSSCLPRRLVCSKSKQTNVDGRSREDAQSYNKSRFHSKFGRKVKFIPNTDNNLHRSNVLFKRGNSSSYFRTNNQTSVRNRKYLKNGKSSYSKRLSSSINYYGFLHRTNTECKVVHATNSVTPFFSLETIKSNSGSKRSFFETFKKSSKMVVEPGKSKQGQVHNSMKHIDNSDNRRFQKRVRGSPKQKRDFSRYLVQKRESTSHKCIRNGSSNVINTCTTFPSKISRQKCSDTLGQFNCSKIHKQTRGHTLSSVVHENLETMAIGIRQSDVAESSTHGREKNILADRLSRFKVQPTEWTLNKKIVLKLFTIWEVPHIDLFASHQTQIYYTPTHREGAILQSPCLSVRPFVRPFRSHFRNRYISFYWKK